jgi:hypothetical protein
MKFTVSALLFIHAFAAPASLEKRDSISGVLGCRAKFGQADCNIAKEKANTATATASKLQGNGTFKSAIITRAFRNCYWGALMTHSLSSTKARQICELHEKSSGNSQSDKLMNKFNTERGIEIFQQFKSLDKVLLTCIDRAVNRQLQTCPGCAPGM